MNASEDIETSYHCPRCGRDCKFSKKLNGLCRDCFNKEKEKGVKAISLRAKLCYNCGKIKINNVWNTRKELPQKLCQIVEGKLNAVAECSILNGVNEELFGRKEIAFTYQAKTEGMVIGQNEIVLTLQSELCEVCKKKLAGELNTAILRIRARKNIDTKMRQVLDKVKEIFYAEGRGEYIKVEKVSNGIDIFLSSVAIAKKIEGSLRNSFSTEIESFSVKKKDEDLDKIRTIKKKTIRLKEQL